MVDEEVPVVGEFELDEDTQLTDVPPGPDSTSFELPEHVNVLFLQTIEGVDLPDETVQGLKVLLRDHQNTFASSSTDLGFCPLVEHDIDTGMPDQSSSHHVDRRLPLERLKMKFSMKCWKRESSSHPIRLGRHRFA